MEKVRAVVVQVILIGLVYGFHAIPVDIRCKIGEIVAGLRGIANDIEGTESVSDTSSHLNQIRHIVTLAIHGGNVLVVDVDSFLAL